MKENGKSNLERRTPKQDRAKQTVDAVLEAVIKLLKQERAEALTTNRIAEAAGVSIGSLYQYFADKQAIFTALHARHVQEMGNLIESTLVQHASSSFESLTRALLEAMVDAHVFEPELHQLLRSELPNGQPGAFASRIEGALRDAIAARASEGLHANLDRLLFVLPNLMEALSHGAALGGKSRLAPAAAKEEAVRALLAYLHSSRV